MPPPSCLAAASVRYFPWVVVVPSPGRLIVANTHLYFHPNAAHIRLMQLVALVERCVAAYACDRLSSKSDGVQGGTQTRTPVWAGILVMLDSFLACRWWFALPTST